MRSWIFEKRKKIDKSLAKLRGGGRERGRDPIDAIDPSGAQTLTRTYFKNL